MSTAAITIRTSDEDKKAIARFAHSIGMSTSAFATVVLLQAVREQKVVLKPNLEPGDELAATLRDADADIKAGRNLSPVFDNADDFLADLESEAR
jgi:antitoxin component of RelBE/YafQ-DinJ toxin-antitoxin module